MRTKADSLSKSPPGRRAIIRRRGEGTPWVGHVGSGAEAVDVEAESAAAVAMEARVCAGAGAEAGAGVGAGVAGRQAEGAGTNTTGRPRGACSSKTGGSRVRRVSE